MIVITVMDFQQLQIRVRELARASPAHPGVDAQRLFAITLGTLSGRTPRLSDDSIPKSP